MKIIIRDTAGKAHELPADWRFVEVCDDDGSIGCALYKTGGGTLRIIYPDDIKEVKKYESAFNVKFCKQTVEVPVTINDNRNTL